MTQQGRPFVDGLRILDLTTALSGPYCSSILADLGADVVSVEPVTGEPMRNRRSARDGIGYPFQMVHHDKRSIALDLRDARGAAIVTRLAATADVVVENFRPGVLARYGLDATTLRATHPALIYCSISGYGHTGPARGRAGVDLVAQAHAGLMSVTGEPGTEPVKAGFPVSDIGAGMWAAIGILAALARRNRTGEGAIIDIALTDGVLAWAVWEVADYQMTGVVPEALGSAHRLVAPYQGFCCGDGKWLVFAGLATRWEALCATLRAPSLLDDPRFATESGRYAHRGELAEIITDSLAAAPRDLWLQRLREIGIPAGPINSIAEVFNDEQFRARDMLRSIIVDDVEVRALNCPIKSDGTAGVRRAAPGVGEHTVAILTELGYDASTIEEYIAAGVLAASRSDKAQEPA